MAPNDSDSGKLPDVSEVRMQATFMYEQPDKGVYNSTIGSDTKPVLSADAETQIAIAKEISTVAMETRLRAMGLLEHPGVSESVQSVQASPPSSPETGGTEFAVRALAPILKSRVALNYLVEQLTRQFTPDELFERGVDLPADDADIDMDAMRPVIADKDHIEVKKVGGGGMGGIYAVFVDGEVRIRKVNNQPLGQRGGNPTLIERFDRESTITESLKGQGVPRFIRGGTLTGTDGKTYQYFEYECLPRHSLEQLKKAFSDVDASVTAAAVSQASIVLTQPEPFSEWGEATQEEVPRKDESTGDSAGEFSITANPAEAANELSTLRTRYPKWFVNRIGAEVALRMAHCHSKNVIHRDLKPGNIMITDGDPRKKGGQVEIIDFGLADDPQYKELTMSTDVFGSVNYMSPEQLDKSKNCTTKSDVWSFGVILYEMYVGRRPFAGQQAVEVIRSMQQYLGDEHRFEKYFGMIRDEELREMIGRMLEIQPQLRPTMEEVSEFFFKRCPELCNDGERMQGKYPDFTSFKGDAFTGHPIPMPKREGVVEVTDFVGDLLQTNAEIAEQLGELSDDPIDFGVRHETVLHSILTQAPDDVEIFEDLLSPPKKVKKSVVLAWAAAGLLGLVIVGGVIAIVYKGGGNNQRNHISQNDDEKAREAMRNAQSDLLSVLARQDALRSRIDTALANVVTALGNLPAGQHQQFIDRLQQSVKLHGYELTVDGDKLTLINPERQAALVTAKTALLEKLQNRVNQQHPDIAPALAAFNAALLRVDTGYRQTILSELRGSGEGYTVAETENGEVTVLLAGISMHTFKEGVFYTDQANSLVAYTLNNSRGTPLTFDRDVTYRQSPDDIPQGANGVTLSYVTFTQQELQTLTSQISPSAEDVSQYTNGQMFWSVSNGTGEHVIFNPRLGAIRVVTTDEGVVEMYPTKEDAGHDADLSAFLKNLGRVTFGSTETRTGFEGQPASITRAANRSISVFAQYTFGENSDEHNAVK